MIPLSETEIGSLRSLQEETMTTACTVVHDILEADGFGGQQKTGETRTNTYCRISPARFPMETLVIKEEGVRVQYIISLPWGTMIERGDRIEIGSRTFGVIATYDIETFGGPTAVRCFCEEI